MEGDGEGESEGETGNRERALGKPERDGGKTRLTNQPAQHSPGNPHRRRCSNGSAFAVPLLHAAALRWGLLGLTSFKFG